MKIYYAASLFNLKEINFNKMVVEQLEAHGHEVFLPQRDGMENATSPPGAPADDANLDGEQYEAIYQKDIDKVTNWADAVVTDLDEPADDGVTVEICKANSADVPVIGFRTDTRQPWGSGYKGVHYFTVAQLYDFIQAETFDVLVKRILTILKIMSKK